MNRYHVISLVLFILGIAFIVVGVLTGDIETGFVFIFPFFTGSGIYVMIGVVLIFSAMVFFMFGFIRPFMNDISFPQDREYLGQKEKMVEGGGVILIGPIPIVFGSSWKIVVLLMVLAAFLMIFIVVLMAAL